ncbi:MAG: hypothetical protein J0L84_10980 [Verrucomicrobia bacterium]|nr:hypothetical protein [Verrucomicrobiota bacterium]
MTRSLAFLLLLLAPLSQLSGESPCRDAHAAIGSPVVASVLPPDVAPGASQRLRVRGQFPEGELFVRLTGLEAPAPVRVVEIIRPTGSSDQQAEGTASGELDVEVTLPAEAPSGTNVALVVATSRGDSSPYPLFVAPAGRVVPETEPNDPFESAPNYPEGQLVRGTLSLAGDEDVYRVNLKSGQTLRAEVWSARLGLPLDAALGLHDRRGMALMVIEDGDGTGADPVLEFQSPGDGPVLLVVRRQEGGPPGGPASAYLLDVQITP